MINVEEELADSFDDNNNNNSNNNNNNNAQSPISEDEEEEEDDEFNPYLMFIPQGCDISGVPKKKSYGRYVYPQNDFQVLAWCGRPTWSYFDQFRLNKLEVYEVKVKSDNFTVEYFLQLLKQIGCPETRFIACSVESPDLFFAELDKEEASKLQALGETCYAGRRADRAFHP
ncbi:uncharacterized protein LOC141721633 [Apium graveolens]|uniref:uncharacterized protein LOC141721633 n=1 Tax=Apium graveolens TaxID=4045 RepID=UPI003D7A69F4